MISRIFDNPYLLAAFLLPLVGDLGKNVEFGLSLHDVVKSRETEFDFLESVAVDGHEQTLDLAGHNGDQTTGGFDGLETDGLGLGLVVDDLLEFDDRGVKSGVGEGLHEENLLVSGGGLVHLVEDLAGVGFLHVTSAHTLIAVGTDARGVFLVADVIDDGTVGQPAGLAEDGRAVRGIRFADALDLVDDLRRRISEI